MDNFKMISDPLKDEKLFKVEAFIRGRLALLQPDKQICSKIGFQTNCLPHPEGFWDKAQEKAYNEILTVIENLNKAAE